MDATEYILFISCAELLPWSSRNRAAIEREATLTANLSYADQHDHAGDCDGSDCARGRGQPDADEPDTLEKLASQIATLKSNHAIALMRLQSRLKALLAAESRRASAVARAAAKAAAKSDRDRAALSERDKRLEGERARTLRDASRAAETEGRKLPARASCDD